MKKAEYIAKYGEEAYKRTLEQDRQRYRANPERARGNSRNWSLKNPERRLEIGRKWNLNNSEKVAKQRQKYREKHKAKIAAWDRKYYEAHKAEIVVKVKRYSQTERGRALGRCHEQRRRALKHSAAGTITPEEFERIIKNQRYRCNMCGKKFTKSRPATADHIVPLSKRGAHISSNIQALCRSCNSSKKDRIMKCFINAWIT